MSSSAKKATITVPRLLWFLAVLGLALSLGYSRPVVETVGPAVWAVKMKLEGKAPHCSWARMFSVGPDLQGFLGRVKEQRSKLHVQDFDESLGIEPISYETKDFWVRRQGTKWGGLDALAYAISEHQWMASQNPEQMVRPGDVVLDCGAHVGVFVHQALQLGAEKVVAIDPEPTQLECLRRNFSQEMATERVVVVPKAVWSQEGTMTLYIGQKNPGMSSLVEEQGAGQVTVPVTTIDQLVAELGLVRVDINKFDIEGATA